MALLALPPPPGDQFRRVDQRIQNPAGTSSATGAFVNIAIDANNTAATVRTGSAEVERCDNCIDDDGDGRVDAEDESGEHAARRVLVEAAWHYRHRPTLGRALAAHPGPTHGVPHPGLARATASASPLPPSRGTRQAPAGRGDGGRPRTRRLHLGRYDAARPSGIDSPQAGARGMRFLRGVAAGTMQARLESPRRTYATPGPGTGTTRAPRRRPLPTNHGLRLCPGNPRISA